MDARRGAGDVAAVWTILLETSGDSRKINDEKGGALTTVEVYNPVKNKWQKKADLLTPRYRHTSSVVKGKLYVISGLDNNNFVSRVDAYDPLTDTCTRKSGMPRRRYLHAAAVVAGKIHIIGGTPINASVEVFDPAINAWTKQTQMPTSRAGLSASVLDGQIYAIGGATS